MAKPPSSAIGVDVGRHSIKAVRLQRRNADRLALTHFAIKEFPQEGSALEGLEEHLKALLPELGGTAKAFGIAPSCPEAMVRIIEQNTIPPELLRDALRFNGPMLLSQECRDWVLDCETIPLAAGTVSASASQMGHYLVAGLPRTEVQKVYEACVKNKLSATVFQLPPVAVLNAFSYANETVFKTQAFVLVDIGHRSSTAIVGVKGELILIRQIEYGGAQFVDNLILHGASSFEEVVGLLGQEEVLTVENARLSLGELVRTVSSSIGFFEARCEETIPRIYVSGGMAKLPAILQIMVEELHLPCEAWDPFADCELTLPRMRIAELTAQRPVLATAFGVAAEILKGR